MGGAFRCYAFTGDSWLGTTSLGHTAAHQKCMDNGGHLVIYDNYLEQYTVGASS